MYRLAMEKAKKKIRKFKIIYVDIHGKDSGKISFIKFTKNWNTFQTSAQKLYIPISMEFLL